MSIRVLIADDHTIVRDGIGRAIGQEQDIELAGEAGDGRTAVELARELAPDVVIMDISLPELNGIEATRLIRRDVPQTRVIALSMHAAKRYVREMFKAGAAAYLLKDCELDELTEAIRLVAKGKTYVTPAVSETVLQSCMGDSQDGEGGAFSVLTAREREVLQLMAEGHATKRIGKHLHISPKTVEAHRLRIMRKLDIDNVAQLTKYAIQEGLTSPQP